MISQPVSHYHNHQWSTHSSTRAHTQITFCGLQVAEGVGRSLDPEIDLLKLAAPILLREKAKLAFVSRTRAK